MRLHPKKSLGQHFLNSKHVLEQIISAARIKPGEIILEIGPGTGALTEALLNAGAKVVAVEKDARACELLKEKFSKEIVAGQLGLVCGDILDPKIFNAQDPPLLASYSLLPASYALVANIPYYITGAILERFLEYRPRPDRMVLLVQKEVADRIVARSTDPNKRPGKESILSISVKTFGTPRIVARVPRGAFTPAPKVDSAILTIDDISDKRFKEGKGGGKNAIDIKKFFEIVHAGFAHKRKYLMRNLEPIMGKEGVARVWVELKLDRKVRAEDITMGQWFEIVALTTL